MTCQADISVVIPTFNRAQTILRALQSVINQSLTPREILVIDDGSIDSTVELIKQKFSGDAYPNLKILQHRKNLGVSKARNKGICQSEGKWIAFLDSDDEWKRDKLERQWQALAIQSNYKICHTDEIWIRQGVRVNPMKKHQKRGGWIYAYCLPLCCVSPSSVLVERQVLLDVDGFDVSLPVCEDYDLWLRLFSRYPILYIDQPLLIKYGGHADQLSSKYWGMDRFRVRALVKILEQGVLSEYERNKTINTLLEKLKILLQGFAKRGNKTQLSVYQRLFDHWRAQGD